MKRHDGPPPPATTPATAEVATTPCLQLDRLSLRLPAGADRAYAVQDLSLSLARGQVLCVVGESGSGKSMMAHAVMGLLPDAVQVEHGRILVQGQDLLALPATERPHWRGRRAGMIFQEPMTSLNPLQAVGRAIGEVFEAHGLRDARVRDERVAALLAEVGFADTRAIARSHPHMLSGGQRQRVMIAMALALEPALLIADEPTTALDVTTQAQILALIDGLRRRRGTGVLFITHDFGVVAQVADQVAVMQHGRLVEHGTAGQVLRHGRHPYTRQLLAAVPGGRLAPPAPAAPPRPAVLEVQNLRKVYGRSAGLFGTPRRVVALDDVSFTLHRGETLGLVGESGSGKSTLGRCLIQLLRADSGTVRLDGEDLGALTPERLRMRRRSIQMVFQDPYASLNPRRKIGWSVAQALLAAGMPAAQAWRVAEQQLERVGLDSAAAHRLPHAFSGGQRQRIGIARALAPQPSVVIADEAVSALDVSVQAQVLQLLRDLRAQLGIAMVFITHDLRVAAELCDRIAVLQHGRLVEIGPTHEVFTAPRAAYTRSLLDAIPGHGHRTPGMP